MSCRELLPISGVGKMEGKEGGKEGGREGGRESSVFDGEPQLLLQKINGLMA